MTKTFGSQEWFESMFVSVPQGYDKWGHQWRGSQKFRYSLCMKMLHLISFPKTNSTILDIGCGMGNFTQWMQYLFPHFSIRGMDISQKAIHYATKKYDTIDFFTGSLPNVPLKNNSCDFILCLEVLYYLTDEEKVRSLNSMHSVLSDDGVLMLSGVLDGGKRYFNEKKLLADLSVYYDVISIDYNYSILYGFLEKQLLLVLTYIDLIEKAANIPKDEIMNNISDSKHLKIMKTGYTLIHTLPYGASMCRGTAYVSKKMIRALLSWEFPVRLGYQMTKFILGDKGRTQIIILARKKHLDGKNV